MDKWEVFLRIRDRSIFSLLPEAGAHKLVEVAEHCWFGPGEMIRREQEPSFLYVVAEGAVLMKGAEPGSGATERITAGRSLELSTLISVQEKWRHDWISETKTLLFKIPFVAFESVLEESPDLKKYLYKITLHPELFRFKNDLRMFGISEVQIPATFKYLRPIEFKRFRESEDARQRGILVVRAGSLAFSRQDQDRVQELGHFLIGDYFVWHPEHLSLRTEAAPDTDVWWLSFPVWTRALNSEEVLSFVKIIDPITQRLADLEVMERNRKAAEERRDRSIELPEDDSVDPNDFLATPEELARIWRKKPIAVLQHERMDCGAACLATVALFHGKKISLGHFRSLVSVGRDGASMLGLKTGAAKVGLQSVGLALDYEDLLDLRPPYIALFEYHYVVVFKATESEVLLANPSIGLVRLAPEEFQKQWQGFVLALRPTEQFHQLEESRPALNKYLELLSGSSRTLLELLLASLLIFLAGFSLPVFLQFVFDTALPESKASLLNAVAASTIAFALVGVIVSWARSVILGHFLSRLDAKFSALFMRHVLSLPLGFFALRRVGDVVSRLGEIGRLRDTVVNLTVEVVVSLVAAAFYALCLALYSGKLAAWVLGTILVIPVMMVYAMPAIVVRMRTVSNKMGEALGAAAEHFAALETIRSLNGTIAARWRWAEIQDEVYAKRREATFRLDCLAGAISLSAEFISISTLLFAVWLHLSGQLTLGHVIAVNGLVAGIVVPIVALGMRWNELGLALSSLSRLDDVITSAPEAGASTSDEADAPARRLKGEIELRNLTFRYGGELSDPVLDGVSLKIEAGETVAFVGRSGCGKSTLAYMINRLYSASEGNVLIDGIDVNEMPLRELRGSIGLVIQENSAFSGTILENITAGERHPSFPRAMAAAKLADAHDFILRLPKGYSTVLSERGVGLSGGQKQRINIARALYRDPSILIMDEATASLDGISERKIMDNIRQSGRKRTTIIVAHRLNTIVHADRIVVIDSGRILETGTHRELMRQQGVYANLFRKQMNR